jgi:hypothetical protein
MANKLNMFSKHVLVKSCILKHLYEKKQYIQLLLETLIDFSHGRIRQSLIVVQTVCRCNRLIVEGRQDRVC